VQVLHSPQKFERPPCGNGCGYSIENYGIEVALNGMISPLNFIEIYQLIQTLMGVGGGERHTGGIVISLTYIFSLGMKAG
jgi:hypothetical protein